MLIVSKQASLAALAILASASPASATEAHYRCSGGAKVTAEFSSPGAARGRVALTFGTGRVLTLPQVLSADGGRYANADTEFWIKGQRATLTMNGVKQTCATPGARGKLKRQSSSIGMIVVWVSSLTSRN